MTPNDAHYAANIEANGHVNWNRGYVGSLEKLGFVLIPRDNRKMHSGDIIAPLPHPDFDGGWVESMIVWKFDLGVDADGQAVSLHERYAAVSDETRKSVNDLLGIKKR